jgi:hypothetical protein
MKGKIGSMQKHRSSVLLLLALLAVAPVRAQQSERVREYIERYKALAISEMQRTGVPASIKLAQGINETMAGTSDLVLRSNNHFGIKCKSNWTGESVRHDDDARGECFRKYTSPEDSYRDHSDFLRSNQRYAFLFTIDPEDYSGWAQGLKKAGYATNPRYAPALIKTIEDYGLQEYTLLALGKEVQEPQQTIPVPADPPLDQSVPSPPSIRRETYPAGVFLIHETRVVFVPAGTPYLAVAREYGIDLAKLFEFNELVRMEVTDKDRLLYLQRKRKTGASAIHVVQAGESLHDIAQHQAIRIESLLELNGLRTGDRPAVGATLSLRERVAVPPRLVQADANSPLPAQGSH